MKSITVKKSTSLTTIAKEQGLPDWRTIQNVNDDLRSKKRDDLIDVGTKLSIPLKKAEYDHLIETLKTVKQNLGEHRLLALQDLEQAKRRADRWETGIDTLADVLTGDGLKALKYTGVVRRQHIERMALELLQAATSMVGDYKSHGGLGKTLDIFTAALSKQPLKRKVETLVRGTARQIKKDVAKKAVEKAGDYIFGAASGLWIELAVERHPSTAAKLFVLWRTGESPDHAYSEAKSLLTETADRSDRRLADTITNLSDEKERAYGKDVKDVKDINAEDFAVDSSVSTVTTQ